MREKEMLSELNLTMAEALHYGFTSSFLRKVICGDEKAIERFERIKAQKPYQRGSAVDELKRSFDSMRLR